MTTSTSTGYSAMSAHDQELFRTWLLALLKIQTVQVTFKKAAGETRIMSATLNPSQLPESPADNSKQPRTQSELACAVFDTQIKQWRSFRWDSIRSISFEFDK